jgi:hypothetical protein
MIFFFHLLENEAYTLYSHPDRRLKQGFNKKEYLIKEDHTCLLSLDLAPTIPPTVQHS